MKILWAFMLMAIASSAVAAEPKTVKDSIGREIQVPVKPERIVVLNEPVITIPLIELGIDPVASLGRNDDGTYQFGADFIDEVLGQGHKKPVGFGLNGQIDLEKLATLKPDLIIGTEFDRDKVDQLSAIAPVYLQRFASGPLDKFAIEEELARLTGREDAFASLKKDYRNRVEQLLVKSGGALKGKTYLMVLVADQFSLIGAGSGATQGLEDVGYKRLALDNDANNADKQNALMLKVSPEYFGGLNPDLLVIIGSWALTSGDETTTKAAVERLVPGWKKFMKPAAEGRVLFLDSAKVFSPAFSSANHTLDALEQNMLSK